MNQTFKFKTISGYHLGPLTCKVDKCSFNIFTCLLYIDDNIFRQGLVHGWDSFKPWCDHVTGNLHRLPHFILHVASWKCRNKDHRHKERRQAEGHTWVYTHTPTPHTHPYVCSHKYWVYTDMYSYLQVSSLNFKLLRFVNSVSPIFPFWSFSCVFTQRRSSSSLLFSFFISPVSLPSAPCFTHPCSFFFFSLSLQLWITLNFSQPSFSALLLHDTSQRNWHQLDLCKMLQPVIERETGKLMMKWWKVISNVLLQYLSCSQTSFTDTHPHTHGWHTHTVNSYLKLFLPSGPNLSGWPNIFILAEEKMFECLFECDIAQSIAGRIDGTVDVTQPVANSPHCWGCSWSRRC